MPGIEYFVDLDKDGVLENVDLENPPLPKQGEREWMIEFYRSIKYPPGARQAGIGGIVMLDVSVNAFGMVDNVGIAQSLSRDCDIEAVRAFKQSTSNGYEPFVIKGEYMKWRMEMPVRFSLE